MLKSLGFGTIRTARHFLNPNRCSEVTKNGPLVTTRHSSSFCKRYSLYRSSAREHVSFKLFRPKNNLFSTCARNFSVLSRRHTLRNHAQIAWRSLFQKRAYSGLVVPPISRIARNSFSALSRRYTLKYHAQIAWKRLSQMCSNCGVGFAQISNLTRAVSLALFKSPLVAPGIIALLMGRTVRTEWAGADAPKYMPKGTDLYMHAQDGHIYLTSFILSAFEGLILFMRAIYLAILFSPTIAMAPFADSLGVQFRTTWLHLVRLTLEQAGPAFIKWGQWAATRPDLFPKDLCIELSKLHTKAPEHSFSYTKKAIEKAFGRKLLDIFDDFEEAPVASGSVAQVHRATLKFRYPGKQAKPIVVAVKVRHPGVGESIRRDFVIIHFFAKISNFIPTLKWLRLDESVQQFRTFMMSQVDLSSEAAHLTRFNYNFRHRKNVSFPKPLYPLVHPAVLVETYEKGDSVSRYIDDGDVLEGNEQTKQALAHIGTHALLKMLLVDNFIHADLHPGNILVRVAKGKPKRKGLFESKPHVVFLDVGMTAELSRSDRDNLLEFFKAVAVRDGRTAAECTLRLSKKQNCPDRNAFIEEVEKSFTFWGTKEGDVVHPAECMHQLLEKVRRHKVNVDGNVCTVMVTFLVLEGWQRKLDPDYDVMQTLKTLLLRAGWATSLEYTIKGLMAA
ncbi:hypothetical protein AQUCO_00201408v1 [Aquilegia coerulea]|uniref:ABC1 atypical kinase-like domain-containing protein n=2 Tax=Aquilegia coerulea TaxID=218851 RepID=A0A2G5F7Y6_AQUCA|nr:hypothetical protein AQUCO_00201408v1 [Aquilegia coerulea]PIA64093.1 hypothetical protein AQUCO_00201408v1 [Aquilegia coerulea]